MSAHRQQARLDVPIDVVWELVGDMVPGKRWFRRWLEQSLDGLRAAAVARIEQAQAA